LFWLLSFQFAQDRPKLVVGIVVDQMKMEYLYRFSDDFSANGFKRLMDNGIRTKICILIICLRILRRVMLHSIRNDLLTWNRK
jgi:hypothetical protein